MIIGSHNSWSYLPVKKWWMKPLRFTARCQDLNVYSQYYDYNVRCFDLRVRFNKHKLVVAHGIIEYKISEKELDDILRWMNDCEDVYVRLIHEVRSKKEHTDQRVDDFINFCSEIESKYPNIKFWCGMNLMPQATMDYDFKFYPTCEELYASVCSPKIIDDWYPRLFAKINNKDILKSGTNKDILLIDFVNYGH